MSSISLFETIDAVIPDLWNFFWIAVSAADIPVDNRNSNKTLLASNVNTLSINVLMVNQLSLIV